MVYIDGIDGIDGMRGMRAVSSQFWTRTASSKDGSYPVPDRTCNIAFNFLPFSTYEEQVPYSVPVFNFNKRK